MMNKLMNSQNVKAMALMVLAVLGYSFQPLFVAWNGGESPFLFAAAWGLGVAVCCVCLLLLFYRPLIFSGDVWKMVWQRMGNRYMFGWLVSYFAISLYTWSTQFIDVSIASVLFETWPIVFVVLTWRFFRNESRYREITPFSIILFVVALVGVACVIASQAGGGGLNIFSAAASVSFLALGFGAILGIAAASLVALGGACGLKWASNLGPDLSNTGGQNSKDRLELFGVVVGLAICNAIIAIPISTIGFARNEPVDLTPIAFGVAGGVIIGAIVTVVWRRANLITEDLTLNMMRYATPALAMLWLWLLSLIGGINVGYLIIGLLLIVVANGGLYFVLEIRPSNDERANSERVSASQEIDLDALARNVQIIQEIDVDALARSARIIQESSAQPAEGRGQIDVDALIAAGEGVQVEFKSTLWMNLNPKNPQRRIDALTFEVLETLTAFLNTRGGTLLVGIDDDGKIICVDDDGNHDESGEGRPVGIGIEIDAGIFSNEDKMERRISDMASDRISIAAMSNRIKITRVDYAEGRVLRVDCEPPAEEGEEFLFLTKGSGGNAVPQPYVRTGSSDRGVATR